MEAHEAALSKAKIRLMAKPDSAFFATLCFSMKHKWNSSISTACTYGTTVEYSPEFFMSLNGEEQLFLLLHETLHAAYGHSSRVGNRDHTKWNIAADHVINLQLIARGFSMPKEGLADEQYKGMSAEEVYNKLPDDPSEEPPMLDLVPGDGQSPETDPDIMDRRLKEILIRAAIQSKISGDKPGTIPGDIEILLEELLNPQLPWHKILSKYLNRYNKADYSYKRPNKRFLPDWYIPSLHSIRMADIAVAIDTSGSVTNEEFHVFISEIGGIIRQLRPNVTHTIQFDTKIRSIDKVKNLKQLTKLNFTGRGGTSVKPVMEWAIENRPKVLLIFTDGEFCMPDEFPKIDIIWVIHNNPTFTAPTGKVIHYKVKT